MFLVRRAKEVMDTDVILTPAGMTFNAFLAQPDDAGRLRHLAIIDGKRILGVLRVNTALPDVSEATGSGVTLRELASRDYTIVHEDDIVFDVIQRIWRKRATMALVVSGSGVPRAEKKREARFGSNCCARICPSGPSGATGRGETATDWRLRSARRASARDRKFCEILLSRRFLGDFVW